jgi:alternate signal-mediated exported protein
VAAGVATAVLVGAGTYALWSSEDTFAGGVLTAGDLDMATGQATWEQITPGVGTPGSGLLTDAPPDLVAMPGDVIRVVQPVTTRLRGDNLRAGFSVRLTNQAGQDRYAASFHVEDADGRQVAPATGSAPAGTLVEVPGLAGDDIGVSRLWRVVIRFDVLGEYVWSTQDRPGTSGAFIPGMIQVRLEQVRHGQDFTATGGAP